MESEGENLVQRRNTKTAFLHASFVAGRIQISTRPKLRNIRRNVPPCSYSIIGSSEVHDIKAIEMILDSIPLIGKIL